MSKYIKFLFVALALMICIVLPTGCQGRTSFDVGKPSNDVMSKPMNESEPALEEKPKEYAGDGTDLIPAKLLSTGQNVLINSDGDIIMNFPDSLPNNAAYCIGEKLIFVPEKGAVDFQGKLVFGADYDWIGEFSDGLAPFAFQTEEGTRAGYVDATGNVVIEPAFLGVTPFSQGYAAVLIAEKEWAYIDKNGKIIYSGFANAEPFSEGMAAVSPDGKKYGYISLDGEYVIEPIYQCATSFSEGFAAVAPMTDDVENMKFGYIDTSGDYVLEPMYGTAGEFWGGIAAVAFGGLRDDELHFISKTGDEVIEGTFDIAIPIKKTQEKIFCVRKNGEGQPYFMAVNGEKILADYSPYLYE